MKSIALPFVATLDRLAAACTAPAGNEAAESSEEPLPLRDLLASANHCQRRFPIEFEGGERANLVACLESL